MWRPERDGDRVVAYAAATPPQLRDDVLRAGSQVARGAAAVVVEARAAVRVLEGATARTAVPAAPDEERVQHRPQLATGRGELVDVPPGMLRVRLPLEDSVVDQPAKPVGEHRLGDVEVGLEVGEAPYTVEGVANDEQRPPLADRLQGASE